jgi:hypothetical protein
MPNHRSVHAFDESAFGVWTEFMVRARVMVRVAVRVLVAFGVWTECAVSTGKRSKHPRGMALVTRLQELQASWREKPMASSSVNSCRKTSTVLGEVILVQKLHLALFLSALMHLQYLNGNYSANW